MTLVNVVPHVVLHKKIHVPFTGIFMGRSIGLPAPCAYFRKIMIFDHRVPDFKKCKEACN